MTRKGSAPRLSYSATVMGSGCIMGPGDAAVRVRMSLYCKGEYHRKQSESGQRSRQGQGETIVGVLQRACG